MVKIHNSIQRIAETIIAVDISDYNSLLLEVYTENSVCWSNAASPNTLNVHVSCCVYLTQQNIV